MDKITNEGKDFSMEHEIACGSHFIINKESQSFKLNGSSDGIKDKGIW